MSHTATPALTYAEIDLQAIAHNIRALADHIGPSSSLIAVVKANGYGHGAVEVARTTLVHGAQSLAVARLEEALELRAAGITAPILVMNYTPAEVCHHGIEHDLTLTVNDLHVAQALAQAARARDQIVPIHVKVDTGMGRFGLLPGEVLAYVTQIAEHPELVIEGLFSHFSVADEADLTYTHEQLRIFNAISAQLEAAGFNVPVRHIANSAATLTLPETHLDAVRAGLAIYGMYPSEHVSRSVTLHPAMALKSRVARVRTLPAGSSISYGRTFITERAMPVALVPVGYGDGYHRLASNRGAVLINGHRAPILGRVCMDQIIVDISQAGPVALDDEVVLLGRQGDDCITAEEIAGWAGTINYEVTTSVLPRAQRVYRSAASST